MLSCYFVIGLIINDCSHYSSEYETIIYRQLPMNIGKFPTSNTSINAHKAKIELQTMKSQVLFLYWVSIGSVGMITENSPESA